MCSATSELHHGCMEHTQSDPAGRGPPRRPGVRRPGPPPDQGTSRRTPAAGPRLRARAPPPAAAPARIPRWAVEPRPIRSGDARRAPRTLTPDDRPGRGARPARPPRRRGPVARRSRSSAARPGSARPGSSASSSTGSRPAMAVLRRPGRPGLARPPVRAPVRRARRRPGRADERLELLADRDRPDRRAGAARARGRPRPHASGRRASSCSTTCTGPTPRASRSSNGWPSRAAGRACSSARTGPTRCTAGTRPPRCCPASSAGTRSRTSTSTGSRRSRSGRSSPRSTAASRRTASSRRCTRAPAATRSSSRSSSPRRREDDPDELLGQELPWSLAELVRAQLDDLERRAAARARDRGRARRHPGRLRPAGRGLGLRRGRAHPDPAPPRRPRAARREPRPTRSRSATRWRARRSSPISSVASAAACTRPRSTRCATPTATTSPRIAHHAHGAGQFDDMVAAAREGALRSLHSGSTYQALQLAELGLTRGRRRSRAARHREPGRVAERPARPTRGRFAGPQPRARAARAGDLEAESAALRLICRLDHDVERRRGDHARAPPRSPRSSSGSTKGPEQAKAFAVLARDAHAARRPRRASTSGPTGRSRSRTGSTCPRSGCTREIERARRS